MSQIRILPEHLANQIAAGEVVERPASVVKELLENSLDAHAADITIQIQGNGSHLIRVIDDGEGMDGDDVLLSIERHATSKLKDPNQLAAISTLGFRGEALPSIGSVANLTIVSRPWSKPTGTKAEIRFGRLHGIYEAGSAKGTMVEVRNLFGNVPARRKFLKSARTEFFHIEEVVRNAALAHPDIHFTLRRASKIVLDLAAGDMEQRVRDVFNYSNMLLPLASMPEEQLQISGFLLLPEKTTATGKNRLRVLVNGRPVHNQMVRFTVNDGLRPLLMKGRHAAGLLSIDLPADRIDVNVHPAKQEVRFRSIALVQQAVFNTVTTAVKKYQEQLRSTLFAGKKICGSHDDHVEGESVPTCLQRDNYSASQSVLQSSQDNFPNEFFHVREKRSFVYRQQAVVDNPDSKSNLEKDVANDFAGLTIIGQLFQLYLLCEKDGRFVVIDQHAAHERILYQQLLNGYRRKEIPGQNLMFPVPVDLRPIEADTVAKNREELATLGITVDHFGGTTWVVKSVPALVSHIGAVDILLDIVATLQYPGREKSFGAVPAHVDKILASLACKAAVKAGYRLAPEEMLALLARMQQSELFSHCPHGRPVVAIFAKKDIEKWFLRQ